MATEFRIETPSAETYEKRPDGQTLYERMVGGLPAGGQPGEGYESHDWCTVLESLYDERDGRMGYLQLATFSGRSGAVPTTEDYRGDVTLQILSANDEPREMTLSWAALKALCAAADAWEQEHALQYRQPRDSRN